MAYTHTVQMKKLLPKWLKTAYVIAPPVVSRQNNVGYFGVRKWRAIFAFSPIPSPSPPLLSSPFLCPFALGERKILHPDVTRPRPCHHFHKATLFLFVELVVYSTGVVVVGACWRKKVWCIRLSRVSWLEPKKRRIERVVAIVEGKKELAVVVEVNSQSSN